MTVKTLVPVLILVICISPIAAFGALPAAIVINEVYYDHPGSDTGWEYVELFNNSESTVDISGWYLEAVDGRTGNARIIWFSSQAMSVQPDEILLIAAECRFPSAGLYLLGNIENGPDGVRLCDHDGIVDRVGYGTHDNADLYEFLPAVDVEAGYSLSRKPDGRDTDSNISDFVAAVPSPGIRNWFEHDIEVLTPVCDILCCEGSSPDFQLEVVNRGSSVFRDEAYVRVSLLPSGRGIGRTLILDLEPGAGDSFMFTLFPDSDTDTCITAIIQSLIDMNGHNDTCRALLFFSPGEIVVNEIMYRPGMNGCEWIELYNNSPGAVDVSRWMITDAAGNEGFIGEGPVIIEKGEYTILVDDPGFFKIIHPSCPSDVVAVVGGLPALNDRDSGSYAEMLELIDSSGNLAERVFYRDMMDDERGRSIERYSPKACSVAEGGIWHRCALAEGSTPGEVNSVFSASCQVEDRVQAVPNPFSPLRDKQVVISGVSQPSEKGFKIGIFNMLGLQVRRLFSEKGGADTFSCRWDGKTDIGQPLPTGLYICVVEFFGVGGSVCRRERVCIALSGKSW